MCINNKYICNIFIIYFNNKISNLFLISKKIKFNKLKNKIFK